MTRADYAAHRAMPLSQFYCLYYTGSSGMGRVVVVVTDNCAPAAVAATKYYRCRFIAAARSCRHYSRRRQ